MSRLLLDTTVLIDLSKGSGRVLDTLQSLVDTGWTLGVCAVSVAEFLAGVPRPRRAQTEWWLANFEYWDISREAAVLAGTLRHDLARQGRAFHIPDALMAATAIIIDAVLLTNNVKDYQVQDLKLMRLGR